jgi:putative proteasome-type protease
LAFLAFDATRASVTDVDYPIDVLVTDGATGHLYEKRFDEAALAEASGWWQQKLHAALAEFPLDWHGELGLPGPEKHS